MPLQATFLQSKLCIEKVVKNQMSTEHQQAEIANIIFDKKTINFWQNKSKKISGKDSVENCRAVVVGMRHGILLD